MYSAGARSVYHRAVRQRVFRGLIWIFFASSPTVFAAVDSSDEGWKLAGVRENNVAIYSRPRPGSPLKEFKAVGQIDAIADQAAGIDVVAKTVNRRQSC